MKFRFVSAALSIGFLASSAHAGAVLATPALIASIPGATGQQCLVTNISTKAVEVTIDIVNATAETVAATATTTIQPNGRYYLSFASPGSTTFCRATGLSAKSGRITFAATDGSFNIYSQVTAP